MITRGLNRFNCCESTLIRVDERKPLPGFDTDIMRLASNFGGGGAGWGSMCGAVSGSVMAVGLLLGTEGTESPENYQSKRERMREITQEILQEFESHWGHVNCCDLLGASFRTPEGKQPEIVRLANRILVFRDQRIVGEVDDVDNPDRTYDEISMAIGEHLQ